MRIALFSDAFPPDINGVATATHNLYKAFKAKGHEIYVVTTNHNSNKTELDGDILRIPGIELKKLYGLKMAGFINPTATRIIKKWNLDIIHVQTEAGIGIYGRNLASSLHIPLVYTYHTMYVDYTYYFTKGVLDPTAKEIVKRWTKWVSSSVTELTTPSVKTRNSLRDYKVTRYINVIPNGLDLSAFDEKNIDRRYVEKIISDYNLKDKYVILSLGRIAHEKSVDILIRGYKNYLDQTKDTKSIFLIVGDGPDKENLEVLSSELGLEGRVIFVGKVPQEKVPCFYKVSDLFLSSSITETQGLTFIEAIASKTLVLCRYDDNLQEVIKDKETGFFFIDENHFVDRLTYILSLDEEKRKEIIEKSYERNKRFSLENFYESMLEVYHRAIRKYW